MNPHQTHLLCRALDLAHGISTVLAELRATTDDRQADDPAPRAGCDPPVPGDGDAAPGLFAV
ncbi:hypothetical protein, partial [Saccharomonospora iraqiensis]|uniref:hypothetical protein n=1 Tax=Saccharomonospora iraqiensis TaxID=52698 RepID=UPI00054DBD0D